MIDKIKKKKNKKKNSAAGEKVRPPHNVGQFYRFFSTLHYLIWRGKIQQTI
jgi:hypothetical protein